MTGSAQLWWWPSVIGSHLPELSSGLAIAWHGSHRPSSLQQWFGFRARAVLGRARVGVAWVGCSGLVGMRSLKRCNRRAMQLTLSSLPFPSSCSLASPLARFSFRSRSRSFLLRPFGTQGTVLSGVLMKQSHRLLLQMAL